MEVDIKERRFTILKWTKCKVEESIFEGVTTRFSSTKGTVLRAGPISEAEVLLVNNLSDQDIYECQYVTPQGTAIFMITTIKLQKKLT